MFYHEAAQLQGGGWSPSWPSWPSSTLYVLYITSFYYKYSSNISDTSDINSDLYFFYFDYVSYLQIHPIISSPALTALLSLISILLNYHSLPYLFLVLWLSLTNLSLPYCWWCWQFLEKCSVLIKTKQQLKVLLNGTAVEVELSWHKLQVCRVLFQL